jgi:hypothetical protein
MAGRKPPIAAVRNIFAVGRHLCSGASHLEATASAAKTGQVTPNGSWCTEAGKAAKAVPEHSIQ